MTRLELWPGLLPLGEARWARESRLVAADGTLEVHRGRRVERRDLRGCSMHPAAPVRDLRVSCVTLLIREGHRLTETGPPPRRPATP